MLLGTYEQACVPWSPRETPWDFGSQLLKPDLERITPELSVAFKHYPAMGTIGHQQGRQRAVHVLAGRQPARRPDPRPARLLGRLRRDGRAVAGRRRRARPRDLDDGRRSRRLRDGYLGDGRGPLRRLRHARLHERQGPGELPPPVPDHVPQRGAAGRPAAAHDPDPRPASPRRTPCGARPFGLEHALWFQKPGLEPKEDVTFRRSNAWKCVGRGGRARSASGSGMTEISNYAKYRVSGPGAEAWLSSLLTARMPAPGRITLTAMLNDAGTDRRRVHGRPRDRGRGVLPVRLACRPRSITAAGSATTCRPTAASGSRSSVWADRPVDRRAAIARRPARRCPTSTSRPSRSGS